MIRPAVFLVVASIALIARAETPAEFNHRNGTDDDNWVTLAGPVTRPQSDPPSPNTFDPHFFDRWEEQLRRSKPIVPLTTTNPSIPSTQPSDGVARDPVDGYPVALHQFRDNQLSTYVHDFVVAQNELNALNSSRMPKSYAGGPREFIRNKKAQQVDLGYQIRQLRARAKAFEQLPMEQVQRLSLEIELKRRAINKIVSARLTSQYRTPQSAASTVFRSNSAIQTFQSMGPDSGNWSVTYVSRDGVVRAGRVHIEFLNGTNGSDGGGESFVPTTAFLTGLNGQCEALIVPDPYPPEPEIEWDGKTGFSAR